MTKLATGALALEDGSIFWGEGHGATGIAAGERVNRRQEDFAIGT